jgi:hypothetical protein
MVNGKGRCEGKGLGIERDRKGRREWKGRIEIWEGRESSGCLPIRHSIPNLGRFVCHHLGRGVKG